MARKAREDASSMGARQREIAVSEFFSKNRHLLGFDNATKSLLTAVREAVDNALDACEEAEILPEIHVEITRVEEGRYRIAIEDNGPGILKSQLPKIFGKLLYGSKFHRIKQSRGQQGIGISAAVMYAQMTTGQPAVVVSKTGKSRPANRIKLQLDTKKNVPQVLSEELDESEHWQNKVSGTRIEMVLEGAYKGGKHGVEAYMRQTALANAHAALSLTDPKGRTIDLPRVSLTPPPEAVEIKPHPHGVELGTLMHRLMDARGKTVSGFLTESFSRVSAATAADICKRARVRGSMPATTAGRTDAEALYKSIQDTQLRPPPTDCLSPIGEENLIKGLYWLFVEAQRDDQDRKAQRAAAEIGEEVSENTTVLGAVADGETTADAQSAAAEPEADAAAPDDVVGQAALSLGEKKPVSGETVTVNIHLDEDQSFASEKDGYFVTAVTRPPSVYRGNPFQVEVGLLWSRGLASDELARVYRFANRVPLLYQGSACAMQKASVSAPWKNYGLQQGRGALPTGPVVIMVHMASGWVPYTSESKEAIAHYPEIIKELRLALMEAGRRLARFIKRKKREADEAKKRSYITKYLDPIGEALQEILELSDDDRTGTVESLQNILEATRSPTGARRKKATKPASAADDALPLMAAAAGADARPAEGSAGATGDGA